MDGDALEPGLITSEIEEAMKKLGRKKAEGCDGIPAESLHALRGEPLNQVIVQLTKTRALNLWNNFLTKGSFCY